MRKWLIFLVLTLSPLLAEITFAAQSPAELSFLDIWARISKNSHGEKGAVSALSAAKIESRRSALLGRPRIYIDGRVFGTNDPAASFVSLLDQRAITASDFQPGNLNNPGAQFFETTIAGIDLPLYDGGLKTAQTEMSDRLVQARTLDEKAVLQKEYLEAAAHFGTLLALEKEKSGLEALRNNVDGIISRYQLGSRTNPAGYSGLLSMKNLKIRIEEALTENRSRIFHSRLALEQFASGLPEGWAPAGPLPEFLRTALPPSAAAGGRSPGVEALFSEADALARRAEGEKAKNRPRVGLFSEGSVYGGNRDMAASLTAGAYVKWEISPGDRFGRAEEAVLSAEAAREAGEAAAQRESIETRAAEQKAAELSGRAGLAEESLKLNEEQTRVFRQLFQNGSISLLQYSEVFERRLDLLTRLLEIETGLVKESAVRRAGTGGELPLFPEGGLR